MSSISLSVQHSYNIGDLITILPGLQYFYEETGRKTIIYQRLDLEAFYYDGAKHPVKKNGVNVCMNKQMFDMAKSLIESQYYIDSFKEWTGQLFEFTFDQSRDKKSIPMPYSDIYHWPMFVIPQLSCDLSKSWISVEKDKAYSDKIIINRTSRYQNPYVSYFFLKEHQDEIIFAGTKEEHIDFNDKWGLGIQYVEFPTLYDLAVAINSCKFFIGNQSACFHISNGLKTPRILEVCSVFPNTLPIGKNGYAFLYQDALEYFFNKLNKE